jgi:murein L,D-transpeptidase YcbB/YkuD
VREITALANATSDVDRLNRDLLMTDGLIHYASDVAAGKLTSRQTDERYEDHQSSLGLPQYLAASVTLDSADLRQFLSNLAPQSPQYQAVKAMLPGIMQSKAAGARCPMAARSILARAIRRCRCCASALSLRAGCR